LAAKILKAGLPLPPTFSPTVKPLTFGFMIQIAIALGLIWCISDIKAAYLNVPRPAGEIPILTKLEPFVAEINCTASTNAYTDCQTRVDTSTDTATATH
jgi:hypothetical protein